MQTNKQQSASDGVTADLGLPPADELVANLKALAGQEEAIALTLAALETGTFRHPDGRSEELENVRLDLAQAGLLAHLARDCPKLLSIEVGFGMGTSASIILGARRLAGRPFAHLIFDPFGLSRGRGQVVQAYLQARFPKAFRRVKKRSEVGLGALVGRGGRAAAGLIFIDGGHHFENVMADFVLADLLCCPGGHIVFDDACYPAIETAINYIAANRPDYAVANLAVPNTAILTKIGGDRRAWESFKPFAVPQREDWTALPSESSVSGGRSGQGR
jgi:Methyltransferase domain